MLAKMHSRHSAYFLLALMALAMEAVFGWRASVMYEHFLAPYIGDIELTAFRIVVFLGVAVGGYVLATHRQYGVEAIAARIRARGAYKAHADAQITSNDTAILAAMAVVIIHDWAGVVYTVFGEHAVINTIKIVVVIGMCAFCLLPFLLGHMMLALAESINAERDQAYGHKIDALDRKVRIQAAEEIAAQSSDLSAQERLTYGIKGLMPSRQESQSPNTGALMTDQVDQQSRAKTNHR